VNRQVKNLVEFLDVVEKQMKFFTDPL